MTFFCTATGDVDIGKNPADEDITEFRWVTKKEFLQLAVMGGSLHNLVAGLQGF